MAKQPRKKGFAPMSEYIKTKQFRRNVAKVTNNEKEEIALFKKLGLPAEFRL